MNQKGFTLIEILITTAISAVLVLALGGLANRAISAWQYSHERQELLYQGDFAMNHIIQSIREAQSITTPSINTSGNILAIIPNSAVDPNQYPVKYTVNGNSLQETINNGTPQDIAKAEIITLDATNTPIDRTPGDNATQIDITLTLSGTSNEPIVLKSAVMRGNGG